MQKIVIGCLLGALCLLPMTAHAADKKTVGAILTLSGSALMLAAFNYNGDQCPEGYSTHTFENLPTQCVSISSFGSDVRQATTGVTFKRPVLMWSGLGAAATGIVLLLLPDRAQQVVDLTVTPDGWLASKTFGF